MVRLSIFNIIATAALGATLSLAAPAELEASEKRCSFQKGVVMYTCNGMGFDSPPSLCTYAYLQQGGNFLAQVTTVGYGRVNSKNGRLHIRGRVTSAGSPTNSVTVTADGYSKKFTLSKHEGGYEPAGVCKNYCGQEYTQETHVYGFGNMGC